MNEKLDMLFVTIGHPKGDFPILEKVMVFVDEKTTYVQVCKKIRKQVVDNIENHGYVKGTKFKPSELYWEGYISSRSTTPLLTSKNSPNIMK